MDKIRTQTAAQASRRLAAYRNRLKAENLARVEIVLPETVCATAQSIAAKEGAGYLATVSALAQLGLEVYNQTSTMRAANALSLLTNTASQPVYGSCASIGNKTIGAVAPSIDIAAMCATGNLSEPGVLSPLAKFLKARKEG